MLVAYYKYLQEKTAVGSLINFVIFFCTKLKPETFKLNTFDDTFVATFEQT